MKRYVIPTATIPTSANDRTRLSKLNSVRNVYGRNNASSAKMATAAMKMPISRTRRSCDSRMRRSASGEISSNVRLPRSSIWAGDSAESDCD